MLQIRLLRMASAQAAGARYFRTSAVTEGLGMPGTRLPILKRLINENKVGTVCVPQLNSFMLTQRRVMSRTRENVWSASWKPTTDSPV